MTDIDIICLGRVAVDLYAEQYGAELHQAETFKKYVGGCAGNIAIGTARLGLKSAMLSCVGNDDMGEYVINTLKNEGVHTNLVKKLDKHLTGLVLLGISPPDHFPLMFYRNDCADMQISEQQLDNKLFSKSKSLLLTGTGLSSEHMFNITSKSISLAKKNNCKVILDIDYRPVLWGLTSLGNGEDRYIASNIVSEKIQKILSDVDLLVGTEEEICIAGGSSILEQAISTVTQLTSAQIVIKKGEHGCSIITNPNSKPLNVNSPTVTVLNVLGAGDAFLSGFLYGWLNKEPLEKCAEYACICGAVVVTRHACSHSMLYKHELDSLISNSNNNGKTILAYTSHQIVSSQNSLSKKHYNILAFDHRYQFERSYEDYHGMTSELTMKQYNDNKRAFITKFKNLIFYAVNKINNIHSIDNKEYSEYTLGAVDVSTPQSYAPRFKRGVQAKRTTSGFRGQAAESRGLEVNCQQALGIIVDNDYGKDILKSISQSQNTNNCLKIWQPIEKSNTEWLEWADSKQSVYEQLLHNPKFCSVKVLFKYDIDWDFKTKQQELFKLKEIYLCCLSQEKEFLLELILPKADRQNIKILLTAIDDIYNNNINPQLWKIFPLSSKHDWQTLDTHLDKYDPNCKIIILGGDGNIDSISSAIKTASSVSKFNGFAVGRAIFWDVWLQYLSNDIDDNSVISHISERYQKLISIQNKLNKTQ